LDFDVRSFLQDGALSEALEERENEISASIEACSDQPDRLAVLCDELFTVQHQRSALCLLPAIMDACGSWNFEMTDAVVRTLSLYMFADSEEVRQRAWSLMGRLLDSSIKAGEQLGRMACELISDEADSMVKVAGVVTSWTEQIKKRTEDCNRVAVDLRRAKERRDQAVKRYEAAYEAICEFALPRRRRQPEPRPSSCSVA
jgi:hypothetical protein